MTETFVTRPGTIDFGKDYENINIARLILKLLTEDIDNFVISSNDIQFGDFDDIVLEVKSKKQNTNYAVQLKHSNNQKTIQHHEMIAPKGNFSIKKYFESFKKLPERSNHQLIVFTNYLLNPPTKLTLEDFSVKTVQCKPDSLLNSSEKNGRCYQFEILDNEEHSEALNEYESFFKRFFLYTGQDNVQKMKQTISKEFQSNFLCSENEWKQFVDYITNWNKQSGKRRKLKQNLIKNVIAFHMLSPFIQPWGFNSLDNSKVKMLRKAICTFDVTIFGIESYPQLKQIWGIDKSKCEKTVKEAKTILEMFQLHFDIYDVDKINDKEWSVILWLMKERPLLVQNNECSLKAIQLFENNKFVLLGTAPEVTNPSKKLKLFRNLSNLMEYPDILAEVIKTFTISIQGKEEITLQKVFQKRGQLKTITAEDLLLMCGEPLTIGGEPAILPESYVPRHLTSDVIDVKYLRNVDSDTWVFVSCVERGNQEKTLRLQYNAIDYKDYLKNKELQENLKKEKGANEYNLPESLNERKVNTFFKTDLFLEDEISVVLKTNSKIQKYHHLRMTKNGNLKWIFSNNNVSDLKKYISEEKNLIAEEELHKWPIEHNVNIISGEPGIGKSLLAKNLTSNFVADFWVVTLFSEDMLHICRQKFDKEKFESFILKSKGGNNALEQKLLKIMIQRDKVIYVWDGIDETPVENLHTLMNLILIFSKKSVHFVTSRPHLETYLEETFNVFCMSLCKFTFKELISYTEKRLSDKISKNAKEKVLELLQLHQNIFQNPLNLFILTELLQQDLGILDDLNESNFNMSDLFSRFIDEKFNIFYKEKARITCEKFYSHVLETMIENDKLKNVQNFQNVAVKALIPTIEIDCEKFLETIKKNSDYFGIIIKVDDNNFPKFLHTAFAEYLAASYLVENCGNIPDLENIIFEKKNSNIRYMFDLILAKNSKAHLAVLSKNFNLLEQCDDDLINSKDLGGRSPLHLMCSWGLQYPRTFLEQDGDIYYIDNYSFKEVPKEDPQYTKTLFFLLNKCDALENDKIFDLNSVAYAEKADCLYAKAIVLLYRKKKFRRINSDVSLITVLYYSAVYGYDRVLDLYENLPLIKVKIDDGTLLHLAVKHDNYLKKLFEYDIYRESVDSRDFFGQTPLSIACRLNSVKSAELLITYKANINNCYLFDSSALHIASMYGNQEIVKILIENNCDKNCRDSAFNTPLHYSCLHGKEVVVRILLELKVAINSVNHWNKTPLSLASGEGHVNIVKMLLENGADSEIADDVNWTPLHIATYNQREEVVQELISKKANVNPITREGGIPLHMASLYGYINIVKMLIKAGSFIDVPDFVTGGTPLFLAVFRRHSEVVKILLQSGANVNFVDREGYTPLALAVKFHCKDIAKILIEFGAKKHGVDFSLLEGMKDYDYYDTPF